MSREHEVFQKPGQPSYAFWIKGEKCSEKHCPVVLVAHFMMLPPSSPK